MRRALLVLALAFPATAMAAPPQTGFEQRGGASWTTHDEELAFLAAVQAGSPRAAVSEIGRTKLRRPLHLVAIGSPMPHGRDAALHEPTALITCTQHGNEPAGREACLRLLRDLAFTDDALTIELLSRTTWLFIPTANPDGRAANTRENTDTVDINRDHLNLGSAEAQAIAAVVRDWKPDVALDLHEYGPSMPVLYDDSVLWLWPRNLNTDQAVHDLAVELGRRYLVPAANDAGYTTDEYGQYEVADNDVQQTAGDADEGIMRNTMGLRHALGILVETRVDGDPRTGLSEPASTTATQNRRVNSHMSVLAGLVRFMRERGGEAAQVTAAAEARKVAEGQARNAPVYFGGADNQEPTAAQIQNPPPCGYSLTADQLGKVRRTLELHGVEVLNPASSPFVSLGQPAEPLIPLLLDRRGTRRAVEGTAVADNCPAPQPAAAAKPARVAAPCVRARPVLLRLPRPRGTIVSARVRIGSRRLKVVRRGADRVVRVPLRGREGRTVKVRVRLRVRRSGKVRTVTAVRTYRVCK